MSLTKQDKEEIAEIVKQIIGESQTNNDGEPLAMNRLEQLDKEWREKGVKSDSTGLIIAPENVITDDASLFTWNEAMALEEEDKIPEGWRLPTRHELAMICEEFGQNEWGRLDPQKLSSALGMTDTCYWSSTESDSDTAYTLYSNSTMVYPASSDGKCYRNNVRCVKEAENERD